MLDCPQGTVKSRCFRGRAKLAERLQHLRNLEAPGVVVPLDNESMTPTTQMTPTDPPGGDGPTRQGGTP